MFIQRLPLYLLLIGQFGYTEASDVNNLRENSITDKNCLNIVTREIVTSVIISRRCYRQMSRTTGKLWWKKTVYYSSLRTCYGYTYAKKLLNVSVPTCCEGLTESDGVCVDDQNDCKKGFFGADCSQICNCGINSLPSCDKTTGTCFCQSGYTGENCTESISRCNDTGLTDPACNESCTEGFYGFDCQMKCECSDGQSCDPVTGMCFSDKKNDSNGGFTISSRTSRDTQYLEATGSPSVAVIVVILVVVIGLGCAVVAVVLFHRNKKHNRSGMQIDNLSYGLMRQSATSTQSDTMGRSYVNVNGAALCAVSGSANTTTGTLTNEYQEVECKSFSPPKRNKTVNNDYTFVNFKSDNLYLAMNVSKPQMTCSDDGACATGSKADDVYVLPSATNEIIYDVPKPANAIYSVVKHPPRKIDERNENAIENSLEQRDG